MVDALGIEPSWPITDDRFTACPASIAAYASIYSILGGTGSPPEAFELFWCRSLDQLSRSEYQKPLQRQSDSRPWPEPSDNP